MLRGRVSEGPISYPTSAAMGYYTTPCKRPASVSRQRVESPQAGSWAKPRRVVAKVEWHPGELFPRVGFIVTNLLRRSKNVVAFYNKRGTAEHHIKEGKGAIKWTRLSCRTLIANAARLQLHALAYNLGNFMRTLATPVAIGIGRSRACERSDQDRSQGSQPRALRRLPNGRRCHPAPCLR